MRKLLLGFVICILLFVAAATAVPQVFNYQGILRDSSGTLQSGTVSMTFKIFDALTAGTELYNSGATSVTVSNGLYNVELPATSSVFNGNDRWLEVTVGTDKLSPRLKINSVAYAITADTAGSATSATTATNATNADYATLSGTASNAAKVDNYDTSASGSPVGGTLYPLDAGGVLSRVPVSAESASGIALFVNGKLGASGAVVGTGTIAGGSARIPVNNTAVTTNSKIFLTPASTNAIDAKFIKVETVASGSFEVSTWDENLTGSPIPFNYLIIN